jgi:hypothetical protein
VPDERLPTDGYFIYIKQVEEYEEKKRWTKPLTFPSGGGVKEVEHV